VHLLRDLYTSSDIIAYSRPLGAHTLSVSGSLISGDINVTVVRQ
jgi:hypothetical protein